MLQYIPRVTTAVPPPLPNLSVKKTRQPVNAKSSASETKPRQQWTAAPAVGPRGRRELRRAAQQREEPGSATAEVEAVGDVRRVYETWRWRGHKINYRVEGGSRAPHPGSAGRVRRRRAARADVLVWEGSGWDFTCPRLVFTCVSVQACSVCFFADAVSLVKVLKVVAGFWGGWWQDIHGSTFLRRCDQQTGL